MRSRILRLAVATAALVMVSVAPAVAQDTGENTSEPADTTDAPADEAPADEAPAEETSGGEEPTDGGTEEPAAPAPTVAVAVQEGAVLDLTLADQVEVRVVVTLSNPTAQALEDVAVDLTGATLDSAAPTRLEPGEVVDLAASTVVASGEAEGGMITVTAVLTGVFPTGDDVLIAAVDSEPLIEISATVIERGDPPAVPSADGEPDDDGSEEPQVLDEVLDASGEPATPVAAPAELPATGSSTPVLLLVAALAAWSGRAALRRSVPAA